MNTIATETATPDFAAIKTKQQATWDSGDYAKIGTTLQIVGEDLAEALDLPFGTEALDVAAGNGNVTLALARRGANVISTDYVPALLDRGRDRAEAEALEVRFRTADAEDLPFDDGRFSAVVSTFGVMFAPNQARAARELTRVCRGGGKIGLANWTPKGFIGQMLKTIGKHVAPPAGIAPTVRWGDRAWIEETFGGSASSILFSPRTFVFRYASAAHFIAYFREFYGPVHKAFGALDEAGQTALTADLTALIETFNTVTDGTMRVPSEYAEIIVRKA